MKEGCGFSEPKIIDFSNCESLDECLDKLENSKMFRIIYADDTPGTLSEKIRG